MQLRTLYLVLAIAGAVVPYVFFVQYFSSAGADPAGFVKAVFANPAAGGFTADLLISSLVFWVAMFARRRRDDGPNPLPFIALNLTIGLSCALPAYLYAAVPRTPARQPAQATSDGG